MHFHKCVHLLLAKIADIYSLQTKCSSEVIGKPCTNGCSLSPIKKLQLCHY